MAYWIREFERKNSGERYRVYGEAEYIPVLRKQIAEKLKEADWLDDQAFEHDAGLDIKLSGAHALEVELLVIGSMPSKTAADLERECLRLLQINMTTRDIRHVGIIRTHPTGTGPNWTYGKLYPEPTPLGRTDANKIIASVAGRWALADGE